MVDFLCHDGAHQVGKETCMWWGEGVSTLSLITVPSLAIIVHSLCPYQSIFFQLSFKKHNASLDLCHLVGFVFPRSSPVNLLLGHLALKKMTRKIVFGNLRRKSPETVSSLLPRSPNKSRGGG